MASRGALLRASVKGSGAKGAGALGAKGPLISKPKAGAGSVAGIKGIGRPTSIKGIGTAGKGVSKGIGGKGIGGASPLPSRTPGSVAGIKGSGAAGKGVITGTSPRAQQKNNHILIRNFPESWCSSGREILAEFLKAQLDLFGQLSGPVKVSPNLQEAEVIFAQVSDAQEAIETLNGADLRGEEEKDEPGYDGLQLCVKPVSGPGMNKPLSASGANKPTLMRSQEMTSKAMSQPSVPGMSKSALLRSQAAASKGTSKTNEFKPSGQPRLGQMKGSAGGDWGTKNKPLPEYEDGTFAELEGLWNVSFLGEHQWDMKYNIESNGNVKVGKKGTAQIVPAGSPEDCRADDNYLGRYFIAGLKQEWTWEYAWVEDGVLHIHHFSDYHDPSSFSPFGSPNFVSPGEGYLKDSENPEPAKQDWADSAGLADSASSKRKTKPPPPEPEDPPAGLVHVPDFEGTWFRMFQNAQGEAEVGGKCYISENGEVSMGSAKRKLQLVLVGSPEDERQDPNYLFDGCFLLNNAMGKDTWEYMWLENGTIQIHNFGSSETGESPFGSPNCWGVGEATTQKPECWDIVSKLSTQNVGANRKNVGGPLVESWKGGGKGGTLRDMYVVDAQDSWGAPKKKQRTW